MRDDDDDDDAFIYLLESFIRRHVSEYKTCSKAPHNTVY